LKMAFDQPERHSTFATDLKKPDLNREGSDTFRKKVAKYRADVDS